MAVFAEIVRQKICAQASIILQMLYKNLYMLFISVFKTNSL